jgi:hypothetical protein
MALDRDPATRTRTEAFWVLSGLHAVWWYRLTHMLWGWRWKFVARLVSQIEGRGNGIKTNVVNAVDIAKALERPPEYLVNAHHWLILHGRYVCQARQPLCGQCGVRQRCSFKGKTA